MYVCESKRGGEGDVGRKKREKSDRQRERQRKAE